MYICAKTEYGDTLYWNGYQWSEDASDASSYGTWEGSYKMGELRAEYIDDSAFGNGNCRTYHGVRITYIYDI